MIKAAVGSILFILELPEVQTPGVNGFCSDLDPFSGGREQQRPVKS